MLQSGSSQSGSSKRLTPTSVFILLFFKSVLNLESWKSFCPVRSSECVRHRGGAGRDQNLQGDKLLGEFGEAEEEEGGGRKAGVGVELPLSFNDPSGETGPPLKTAEPWKLKAAEGRSPRNS